MNTASRLDITTEIKSLLRVDFTMLPSGAILHATTTSVQSEVQVLDTWIGGNLLEKVWETDKEKLFVALHECSEKGNSKFSTRVIMEDEQRFLGDLELKCISLDPKVLHGTFSTEITTYGINADFEFLFDKVQAPVWILDESGVIMKGNQSAAEVLGYKLDEMVDSTLFLFESEEWRGLVKRTIDNNGKIRKARSKAKKALNLKLDIDVSIEVIMPVYHDKRKWYLVTGFEISETQELRRNLSLTSKEAMIGTWEIDVQTRAIKWSEQSFRIFELDANTPLVRDNLIQFVEHETDRKLLLDAAQRAIAEKKEFSIVAPVITAKGNRKQIQFSGLSLLGQDGKTVVSGTMMDITAQEIKERSLEADRERFKAYVENSMDVTFELSSQGDLLYISPTWTILTGFGIDEIHSSKFTKFVHPEDVPAIIKYIDELLERGYSTHDIEYRAITSDNTYRWHAARGYVRKVDGDVTIVGSARDVHDSIVAKRMLAESESRLNTISRNIPGAIYQTSSSPDGTRTMMYLSDKIVDILKYPKGTIMKHWRDGKFVVEEQREGYLRSIQEALEQRKPWFYECKVNCGDGQVKWLQGRSEMSVINGDVVFNGLILDISDLKFAEEAVRESELRLKTIFETVPECIKIINTEGILTEINSSGLGILDLDDKMHIAGKHIRDLVFEEDVPSLLEAHAKAVSGESALTVYRTWSRTGRVIYMENHMVPLLSVEGKVINVLSVSRDITARQESEQAINQYAGRLQLAIDTGKIGMWEFHVSDNSATWDQRTYEIYDVDPNNTQVYSFWHLRMGPVESERVINAFFDSLKKHAHFEISFAITDSKGMKRHLFSAARPIFEDGVLTKYVGIVRDDSAIYREQEKVAQSEREFRKIFDTVLDGIFVIEVSSKNGLEVTQVNRAVEEITKMSKDELTHRPLTSFLDEETVEVATHHIQQAIESGRAVIWEQSAMFGGERRYMIVSVNPLYYPNGEFEKILGSVKDVTALRSAEIEIDRLALVSRTSTNGAVLVDLQGNIIWVNQTFERIVGLPLEELRGKHRASVGVGEETDRFTLDMLRKKMLEGAEFECEIVNYSVHNQKYWLRMQVQPILGNDSQVEGFFILETDISIRKAEEDQLRMLESVVMHTRDMILVLDHDNRQPINKQIVFVNQSFERIMGMNAQEVLYTSFYDLLNLSPDQEEFRKIATAFAEQEALTFDMEAYRNKVDKYWLNIALTPLLDDEGNCTHWIAILRDVSSRIVREQERDSLIKELTQNNLDLKQFSFITSHNLRAPLTNLLSIASLLEPTEVMDSDTVKLIEGFKTSTNNLNEILNDLIKIVLIKDSSKEGLGRLSLTAHVHKVTSLLKSQIENAQMEIHTDFSQVDDVLFEPSYMDSIIMNLITNSIRYAHADRKPVVKISSALHHDHVEVSYADNGIGIDLKRYGHKVFGLYQRFSSNPEGKGIGLYLVHSQVTALGGEITVNSVLDEGTTFTIKFPLRNGK